MMLTKTQKKKWFWFKNMVKYYRKENDELMHQQYGQNQVMLSISMLDEITRDWIDMNPRTIDLKKGTCFAKVGSKYIELDVKGLLFYREAKPK